MRLGENEHCELWIWNPFVKDVIIGPCIVHSPWKSFVFLFIHFILIYKYTKILEKNVKCIFNTISGWLPIFQQGNATPLDSSYILKWCTEKNIAVM